MLERDVGPYIESLFSKIRTALKPGGRLVIVDQSAPIRGVAPSSWLYWAFLASLENPNSTLLTGMEVRSRLEQVGFQPLSEGSLPQNEVVRWPSDLTLIEASKWRASGALQTRRLATRWSGPGKPSVIL